MLENDTEIFKLKYIINIRTCNSVYSTMKNNAP